MSQVHSGGGAEGTERKRRQESSNLRRPPCFTPAGDPAASDRVDRSSGSGEDGGGSPRRTPTHLVVMVNGIVGSAANWKYAAKQFERRFPEDIVVHRSKRNYNTLTLDGVDVMGERLAEEVRLVIACRPGLQKISFVGHSLGGLIARYAISILYEKRSDIAIREEKNIGKIAGLEPMNFITFATPHLGTRSHKQFPILRGYRTLEKVAYHTCWILGRTGKHLMLKDNKNGKPLLLQMVSDIEGHPFMSALQSFKRRVAYANVSYDALVGWKTSSIRHQNELPQRQNFVKDGQYPHIVYTEKPSDTNIAKMDFSEIIDTAIHKPNELEDAMINGLNRVPWERVDVSFRKSSQRFLAHSTIQVKTYLINSDGADVILHMVDNFDK